MDPEPARGAAGVAAALPAPLTDALGAARAGPGKGKARDQDLVAGLATVAMRASATLILGPG